MADGALVGLERRFFENRGVERTPAGVLAMGDQAVAGTEHAAVGFARGENRVGRNDQRITPDVGISMAFIVPLYLTRCATRPILLRTPIENSVRWATLNLKRGGFGMRTHVLTKVRR